MKSSSEYILPVANGSASWNKATDQLCFVLDAQHHITTASQGFIDFFHIPVLDLPFQSLLPPDEQNRYAALLASARPCMPVQDRLSFITAPEQKSALLTLVAFSNECGLPCYYGLLWEVSAKCRQYELDKLQQLAEENTRKMLAIAESTHDCFFMINAEGCLEYLNQNARQAVGPESGVQLGQSLEELMEKAHALEFLPLYQEVLLTKQARNFEAYYQYRQMWVEVNAFPANGGLLVYFRNINERKKAELRLALSEQKFKAMVHNGSDIIAVLDAHMHLQYLSPSVERIAGYKPEELLGENASPFIHPDDWQEVSEAFAKVLHFTYDGNETAHRFRHKDGHYIWLESKAMNLVHDNCIAGIIINARNITHHKELEAKLALEVQSRQKEVTNAVIRAQERERSQLGQELHDNVNQVLTTVKLYNEMVLEGMGNARELLPRAVFHLQSCINEIRSISKRLSAPTLGKISLYDSIRELVESVNLTNRLTINYKIEGLDGCTVSQDVHLAIYRIIQEQLNNTLKYAQAANLQITITNSSEKLLLVLQDDGEGFDVAQKRSGIGITNMKTRAENLNGSFYICSCPGGGCRVAVMFPPVL